MIYFTSDTHFNHTFLVEYNKRPFDSVEEMDETMIERWNERVTDKDTVYHLGDFAFANTDKSLAILDRLNYSQLFFIRGNHDRHSRKVLDQFTWVKDYHCTKIDDTDIILCHYAMRVWNKSHYGSIMLYGHSHGNLPGNNQSLDVGVDAWDFRPVTFEEIKERLATLPPFIQEDHHEEL